MVAAALANVVTTNTELLSYEYIPRRDSQADKPELQAYATNERLSRSRL